MLIVKSLLYFLLAGLCEIGGGYLMWLWLREGRSLLFGLSGAAILIVYGIVPTLQPEGNFGRVYAAANPCRHCSPTACCAKAHAAILPPR